MTEWKHIHYPNVIVYYDENNVVWYAPNIHALYFFSGTVEGSTFNVEVEFCLN